MTIELHPQEIDTLGGVPLYQQIYQLLRAKIESGVFGFNSKLPAEETLAVDLGVSRITVKRAMNELAAAGFGTRYRGRGTIVSYSHNTPTVRGDYMTPMEHLRQLGFNTEIELKHLEEVHADAELAGHLEITPGALVQRAERVRHLEGAPFSFIVNHTPMDIAAQINRDDIAWRPFTTLLAEAGHMVVSAEQTILAETAKGKTAQALMLAEGAPVLTIHRVLRDSEKRPIQFSVTNYRADRYQYHMVMHDLERKAPAD